MESVEPQETLTRLFESPATFDYLIVFCPKREPSDSRLSKEENRRVNIEFQMISNQLIRSISTSRLCCPRIAPRLTQALANFSRETSSNQNQSTANDKRRQSNSAYQAADFFDYTTFSHYDIEASLTKYRLPQPSAKGPLQVDPIPQKK